MRIFQSLNSLSNHYENLKSQNWFGIYRNMSRRVLMRYSEMDYPLANTRLLSVQYPYLATVRFIISFEFNVVYQSLYHSPLKLFVLPF